MLKVIIALNGIRINMNNIISYYYTEGRGIIVVESGNNNLEYCIASNITKKEVEILLYNIDYYLSGGSIGAALNIQKCLDQIRGNNV